MIEKKKKNSYNYKNKQLRSRHICRVTLTYIYCHGGPVVKNPPANADPWSGKILWVFLVAQRVKNLTAMPETQGQSLGQKDPLGEGMATYLLQYSCLENSMENPEMPGSPQSIGSQRVRYS